MRKRKKIKLATMLTIIVSFLLVASIVIILLGKYRIDQYEEQVINLTYELESNKITVYVASREIKAGEILVDETMVDNEQFYEDDVNIYLLEQINGLPGDFFMQPEDLGCQVTVDVKESEPIMASMLAQTVISTDLREYEISVANLMTDQSEFDYVDVRILFPDGSDYLVLPKKEVKNLHLDNCVFYTYCNEDEILRFSSAIIDAFTTTGAYIYTTRYVESALQEEAIPFYPVRPATLSLMQSDPNILAVAEETLNAQARMNLSTRLGLLTEDQLESVAEGFNLADTAKGTVFQERIDAMEEEQSEEDFTSYGINEMEEEAVGDGGLANPEE